MIVIDMYSIERWWLLVAGLGDLKSNLIHLRRKWAAKRDRLASRGLLRAANWPAILAISTWMCSSQRSFDLKIKCAQRDLMTWYSSIRASVAGVIGVVDGRWRRQPFFIGLVCLSVFVLLVFVWQQCPAANWWPAAIINRLPAACHLCLAVCNWCTHSFFYYFNQRLQ